MTVGSHNFAKFTVMKPNCQNYSGCVFASGKNALYPCDRQIDRQTDKTVPINKVRILRMCVID